MNQIRSGKNDILAARNLDGKKLDSIERDILNHKGPISVPFIVEVLEKYGLDPKSKDIIGKLLIEASTRQDGIITDKVVQKGLEFERKSEMSELEIKEMEYVDQGKYDKLTDWLNKKYPGLKLKQDKYSELGSDPITIEEMRAIDKQLIAIFPEGIPSFIETRMMEQFGINQRRTWMGPDGKMITMKMERGPDGKPSNDLTFQALTGASRGNNGKKYQGEYDAVNITDPGKFKTELRKFREDYKGEDLNGAIYDFARKYLTKKGKKADGTEYTFEETVAANERLRTDYMTGIFEMVRKTPEAERGRVIQGILRHFQMQSNHGTGISKGTFTITGISNILPEMMPGSKSGYHAEHKLQIANYHANVVDIILRNIDNPKGFQKELALLNKDAQQTITKFADKMKYDDPIYGGTSGNIDPATGKPSYSVDKITADIAYLIERPGIASETVSLLGPRGTTLANKIIQNATKKDIKQALSEIKKTDWTADVYSLEFNNNNRETIQKKAENKIEFEANSEVNNEIIVGSRLNLNTDFNLMLEGNYGIGKEKTYSTAKVNMLSKKRKWYQNSSELFVGSRADDFKGLTNYRLVNQKGKKGEH